MPLSCCSPGNGPICSVSPSLYSSVCAIIWIFCLFSSLFLIKGSIFFERTEFLKYEIYLFIYFLYLHIFYSIDVFQNALHSGKVLPVICIKLVLFQINQIASPFNCICYILNWIKFFCVLFLILKIGKLNCLSFINYDG